MTPRVASCGLLVAVLLACGPAQQHARPPSVGPAPGLAEAPTPVAAPVGGAAAATIDGGGGQIAAPGGALVVSLPAGAVAAATQIAVTPIANLARGAAGPAYRLHPEGTIFAVPVTLTFKGPDDYPLGTSIADLAVVTQDASGYWRRVEPVTRDEAANTVSVSTSHFSDWALVLALDTAAAEGPISLAQTVGVPFTASGRATLFFQGDDANDTTYLLTGYLSLLDPASSTTTFTVDGATCVPDAATKTLPLSIAEVHKSTPPVFRWGIGASWTLTCTAPGGAVTVRELPALFDTLSINLTHCGAGAYGAGQVVTPARVAGSYTIQVAGGGECGASGHVYAGWDLAACVDGAACLLGADCRLGATVCAAGIATCVDAGPAPDGTACGPGGASLCSAAICVNPVDPAAGIRVSPTAGLVTREAGGTAFFTIVLDAQPTTTVSVGLSSTAPAEGTVSPSVVVFTPADWSVVRTVSVTGVDDLVMDGDQVYTIVTSPAVSGDPRYSGRDAADVRVTNLDDDVAGFVVSTSGALVTTERGGTASFTVRLRSQPTAPVTVPLRSTNVAEGTVAPGSLTFTAADWAVEQVVTVTGVDDLVADGPQAYAVVSDPAASADPVYAGTLLPDVPVTNLDDDVAGVVATPAAGLETTEGGGTASFSVVLSSRPTADVIVAVTSGDAGEVAAAPAALTFTQSTWNVPQQVVLTGVDDLVADGDQLTTITLATAGSADARYAGLPPGQVAVTNRDDDRAGIRVTTGDPLVTTEAGGTASFTIRLTSQPTAPVTLPLRSTDPAEGSVVPASLTFTASDWAVEQVVTVTGVNDFVADGAKLYAVVSDPAVSADPGYAGTRLAAIPVTNLDDDVAGLVVTPTASLETTEAGGAATFEVVLSSQPTGSVTIQVTSANLGEVTASPATLTFLPSTWNVPAVVTLTGVDDFVVDGDQVTTVSLSPATSADAVFAALAPVAVPVTNRDDDHAGVVVSTTGPLVTTEAGGKAAFAVRLASQPAADVILALRSTNAAEGTVAPASLTFTVADWSVEHVVTVTGVDDFLLDGDQAYAVVSEPAVSADPLYAGTLLPAVSVTNLDNDVAGIAATPASGLVTSESGTTATFDVVLTARPSADVIVTVTSRDPGEVTASPDTLTFAPAAWNQPQRVVLTGVRDFVVDGDQLTTIVLSAGTSGDPAFASLVATNVPVTNTDVDAAGITVALTGGVATLQTTPGGTATFTVVLTSIPSGDVVVPLSSSDVSAGTVGVASVTFTPATWDQAQTVTVTGGAVAAPYSIVTGAAISIDPLYAGTDAADVPALNGP